MLISISVLVPCFKLMSIECLIDQNYCIPCCQMCYQTVENIEIQISHCQMCYQGVKILKYKFHARSQGKQSIHIQLLSIDCFPSFLLVTYFINRWFRISPGPLPIKRSFHVSLGFNVFMRLLWSMDYLMDTISTCREIVLGHLKGVCEFMLLL